MERALSVAGLTITVEVFGRSNETSIVGNQPIVECSRVGGLDMMAVFHDVRGGTVAVARRASREVAAPIHGIAAVIGVGDANGNAGVIDILGTDHMRAISIVRLLNSICPVSFMSTGIPVHGTHMEHEISPIAI